MTLDVLGIISYLLFIPTILALDVALLTAVVVMAGVSAYALLRPRAVAANDV